MIKKVIDGEDYVGSWKRTRIGCRGVVIRDGQILLSYDKKTDFYMIPGGGLEDGESEQECCIRELAEETGTVVVPSECELELVEYRTDWKWVNRYFFAEAVGETEMNLTEREKALESEPRWVPVAFALELFGGYAAYAESFPIKRDIYMREYVALCTMGVKA